MPGKLQYGQVIRWLSDKLPEDAIIAGGAGNFAGWLHRHFRYKGFRTQLGSTNGSMGYGYPAAVAAKLAAPNRTVLGLCGDGDFLMNGQEIATAAQYGAAFVALVVNNGMYGTIRMHQEREYPGRVSGTELKNPDFAAYARAFGGHGEIVEQTEDFAPAYERAAASGKPALIELRIDPDAITPRPPSPPSGRRRLSQGDEFLVVLVGALELQELVVAAALAVRVAAADGRPRLVHGATALLLVEQHAGRLEHLVLAVAQELHLFLGVVLRVALLGLPVADAEVLRQALDVARRDLDFGVAAAVARTFGAGVARAYRYRECCLV